MSKPLIAELEVHHEDCFAIDTTSRIPDSSTKFLAFGGVCKQGIQVLHELRSPDVSLLVNALRNHPRVKNLVVVRRQKDVAEALVLSAQDSLFITAMGVSGCVPIEPTGTMGGTDRCALIAPDDSRLRKLFAALEGDYELKLRSKRYFSDEQISLASFRSSGFLQLKTAAELLTPRQMEAFSFACKEGYYEIPKRTGLEELARAMGISKPTYAELLSKAERKLLPAMNELVRLVK